MEKTSPIGIFDSGVGGLTVVKSLLEKLPGENFIYFGDTAHVPYGNKTDEQLFGYAHQILAFLLNQKVKAVIVACNTHSSITLPSLLKVCSLPLLGVVKAGARVAVRTSLSGRIGVLATQATANSRSYSREIQVLEPDFQVFEIACPGLVPLVESGQLNGPETRAAVQEYVVPLLEKQVDTLILGCTHYPFLAQVIEDYAGQEVALVDPSDETISQVAGLLKEKDLLNDSNAEPWREFYVSGLSDSFYKVGTVLIGDVIRKVRKVDLP
ncbi:MAG TPA: glutamate racemase [Syntrophomonadaceae bacterium]|nr:glutamate racemase [Syntrophomonadaceae bacterium]